MLRNCLLDRAHLQLHAALRPVQDPACQHFIMLRGRALRGSVMSSKTHTHTHTHTHTYRYTHTGTHTHLLQATITKSVGGEEGQRGGEKDASANVFFFFFFFLKKVFLNNLAIL